MKKLFAVAVLALCLFAATAMAADKTYTISVNQIVEHPSLDAMRFGFMDRLKELGLQAEYNVHIAQGNMATNTQIASQIVGEKPDLVLAITTPSAQSVVQKIKDRPIVFTGVTDPVSAGIVKSLEAPGGNVTGMTDMSPMDKHFELIREIVPGIKSIGVIYNAGEPNSVVLIDLLKKFANAEGVNVEEATIANSSGVYQAAKSLVGRCEAVYIPLDNTVVSALESAIKVCRQNHLPLISGDTDSVARGTIAALAVDYRDMGVQTADMAARVLQGADTATMPVESIKRLRLHVNLKAAESMGVTIPEAVVSRADKVIR
ncbi:ABC transporter substrate-binding protein [Salidesulfovibrio onnuriiensis]|uniref:ABC transporter substrate-binding protein n=1 Tax=Salidesulfovibrio onnuriiensis TaxID=2583823 RepID=UPI0011C7C20F|nr:ABC transporter substrate-binding protein [Salidesulfovibrio onnuriiensis]